MDSRKYTLKFNMNWVVYQCLIGFDEAGSFGLNPRPVLEYEQFGKSGFSGASCFSMNWTLAGRASAWAHSFWALAFNMDFLAVCFHFGPE
jgi:hypothetical protein